MAHWFMSAHGTAINLDHARQIFVKEGRDGLYRVCAEFVVSTQTGQTISYSLVAGMQEESEAEAMIPRIVSGDVTDGYRLTDRLYRDELKPDMVLEQVGASTNGRDFLGRDF